MLDGKLFDLARRHRGHLELVVRHSNECGNLFGGWVSGSAPTVLFVRDGQSVAEFIGDLPLNEIERLMTAALSGTAQRAQLCARLGRLGGVR
jgi:thioredoxin-like negative regulator of GroEL